MKVPDRLNCGDMMSLPFVLRIFICFQFVGNAASGVTSLTWKILKSVFPVISQANPSPAKKTASKPLGSDDLSSTIVLWEIAIAGVIGSVNKVQPTAWPKGAMVDVNRQPSFFEFFCPF
jgi:hypothetical protein